MSLWMWILAGGVVGAVAGAFYGVDYALAGIGIGVAAGVGFYFGSRRLDSRQGARGRGREGGRQR